MTIQHAAPRHCERSEAIQSPPPVIANKVKQSRHSPPVIASEAWQSSNPGIEFGGRFTLPTTPSIEFGGHFHLPDNSEVKFEGHSCITDLPDTQIWVHSCIIDLSDTLIWGSFLLYRPARHPNLGGKLPAPRKLHTPLLSKPTNQSESPHLFFAVPRGNHRESSTKRSGGREELARSAWGVVWRSGGRCQRQREFSPIITISVHL